MPVWQFIKPDMKKWDNSGKETITSVLSEMKMNLIKYQITSIQTRKTGIKTVCLAIFKEILGRNYEPILYCNTNSGKYSSS